MPQNRVAQKRQVQKLAPIKQCRIVLFISRVKYPKLPSYIFPIYLLLKYIKLTKRKKTFNLLAVPTSYIADRVKLEPLIDPINCAIINESFLKGILDSVDFVRICGLEKRFLHIIGGEVGDDDILVSDCLVHNFTSKEVAVKLTEGILKIADEVDLSLITSYENVGNAVIECLLKNYFRNPKIVQKNDTLSIDMKKYAPNYYYTSLKCHQVERVHFKVNTISYGSTKDCTEEYFCVIGETAVKQSADVQSFLPKQFFIMKTFGHDDDHYKDVLMEGIPDSLKCWEERMERGIKPFLFNKKIRLRPIFLMQGPLGSGKLLILDNLSKRLGLKLCHLTNNDLSANAYAQNEIKIKNTFFRCKLCAPCIVAIDSFEHLCKNNEGQNDPRIIESFKSETEKLLTNNDHPVVLICLSNIKELPSDLSRMFLETVTINVPNEGERKDILKWLLSKNSLTVSKKFIAEAAGKTHGFVFADLEALLSHAKQMAENGRVLSIENLEYALDMMQSKFTESLGAPKVPKVEWSDIGGLDDVKQEIIKTINLPLKHPELFKTGLKRSGILLYGPPGTGKTLIAKAVATECGLCFLSVKGPELLNMYVGQSEQNIRQVFEKAREAAPCIIFFDELDSLAPNRGISGDSGGVMDRVVSQLLAEMDGLNKNVTLFVIGATNRPDLIDPALLRPGRFDKLQYVGPCTDLMTKISVFKALTRRFNLSEKLNLEKLVKMCPENITGADFYGICSNAWMISAGRLVNKIENGKVNYEDVSHKNIVVTMKDFEEAVKTAKPSISRQDLLYFERLKNELSTKI